MKRLRTLLQQPEFSVVLFVIGLVLFIRPLLAMSVTARAQSVLLSIFLPWAFIIILLFLVSQSLASSGDVSPTDKGTDEDSEEVKDA